MLCEGIYKYEIKGRIQRRGWKTKGDIQMRTKRPIHTSVWIREGYQEELPPLKLPRVQGLLCGFLTRWTGLQVPSWECFYSLKCGQWQETSHVCGQCVGNPWRMDTVMIKNEDLAEEAGQKEEVRKRILDCLLEFQTSCSSLFPYQGERVSEA